MTAVFVVVLIAAFLVVDLVVRAVTKRMEAARAQRERQAVLQSALQLSFAEETKSLKRAELPNPKARILAVDDEAIVLDSFRKILVLAGFSVDTVESGPEALTLLRSRDYDFLFTDLKMPVMDGVEVVKAATHLRPDMEVVVITGYGTIESAVETMQFGAVDYVQKPFTEDELVAMTQRLLIKREARLEATRRPKVRVVALSTAEEAAREGYSVPGGAFVYPGHTWARIDPDGQVSTGIDDFARKALKDVERIELPTSGTKITRGHPLFTVWRGSECIRFLAPVSGEITKVNVALKAQPDLLTQDPYESGWTCVIQPSQLGPELEGLRIGQPVVAWYQEEIQRMRKDREALGAADWRWSDLESHYFGPGVAVNAPFTETVNQR